ARCFWAAIKPPTHSRQVPATEKGIPAIERLPYTWLKINFTLIFAIEVHKRVMEAYPRPLERRVEEGKPIDKIASVASFFVSRVDTKADQALQNLLKSEQDPNKQEHIKALLGTADINKSKMAYQEYLKVCE